VSVKAVFVGHLVRFGCLGNVCIRVYRGQCVHALPVVWAYIIL
jgi:hypothetical protein